MQDLAEINGAAFSLPDGRKQRRRDQLMQQRPPINPSAIPDLRARFGSNEFDSWLDNWDGIQEVSLPTYILLHEVGGLREEEPGLTDAPRRGTR